MREAAHGRLVDAGIGPRLGARIVDSVVLSFITAVVNNIIGDNEYQEISLVTLASNWWLSFFLSLFLQAALFHHFGTTVGKMMFGLKVYRGGGDGPPITFWVNWWRDLLLVLQVVLAVPFCVGWICCWQGLTSGQFLHDTICDTRVLYDEGRH